jgi:hypothetical protein
MTDEKDPRRDGNIGGEPHRIKTNLNQQQTDLYTHSLRVHENPVCRSGKKTTGNTSLVGESLKLYAGVI